MSRFEEEDQSYQQYEIREGINYLIEITPELLEISPELGYSKLFEILQSINELMQELIISDKSTGIGIYFYNCEINKPLKAMSPRDNFCKLFGLKVLNLDNMSRLNDLLQKNINEIFKYKKPETDANLVNILSRVIDVFNGFKYFNKKKLIWITTNDIPYKEDKTKDALWRVIDDYYHYGYNIEPIFIAGNPSKTFNFELFKDIFMNTDFFKKVKTAEINDELESTNEFTKSKIFEKPIITTQIKQNILKAKEIRRIQFTCDLILSDGDEIGGNFGCTIKAYTLYSHEKVKKNELKVYTRVQPMKKVFIDTKIKQNGQIIEIKPEKNKLIAQSKDELGIKRGFDVGNDVVLLNKEQCDFFQNFTFDHRLEEKETEDINIDQEETEDKTVPVSLSQPPYLKLIGFRDLAHFNPVYSYGAPVFITADLSNGLKTSSIPGGFSNSLGTFASLYRSMNKLKQYAIVFGCTRKNARPYLYALIPNKFPDGFILIKLPWVEDVRALPASFLNSDNPSDTNSNMIDLFKSIFPKFEMKDYEPSNWPNPTLNYFYKIMKHEFLQIALSPEERSTENNDLLSKEDKLYIKNLENVKKLSVEERESIKALGLDGEDDRKRPIDESEGGSGKKVKSDTGPVTDDEILIAWKANGLAKFRMDELRVFAKRHKIKSANRKDDFIQNIVKFLDSREVKKE
ncbi:unnamed protein product [Candida verbasci]|uniref:DNA helicase n=1 Tax=Candida verbasci TaxID=1227364 RepID=A0A9W4TU77_9ASCO|nr:unnamed protein product [Candida verbasci]